GGGGRVVGWRVRVGWAATEDGEGPTPWWGAGPSTDQSRVREKLSSLARDEGLQERTALGVFHLHGRGLHEVRRGREDGSALAAVLGDLRGAQGVDDDACRVGRVPDLELVLEVEGGLTEGATLKAHVGPLAVVEPGDVVRGADVDVAVFLLARERTVVEVRRDGLRLRELLGLQALALEHVLE